MNYFDTTFKYFHNVIDVMDENYYWKTSGPRDVLF